ncbi:hypothetical protein EAF00_011278 [Botryotinia globosa]|nr:hypothetical protein EAF00_011278 [Botryotinia globosa]
MNKSLLTFPNSPKKSRIIARKYAQSSPPAEYSDTITVSQAKGLPRTPPQIQASSPLSSVNSNQFVSLNDEAEQSSDSSTFQPAMYFKGRAPAEETTPAWVLSLFSLIAQQREAIAYLTTDLNEIRSGHQSRTSSRNCSLAPLNVNRSSILDSTETVEPPRQNLRPRDFPTNPT